MPDFIPEISGSTVVLVGSFNPKIFQPEWFARQQLLSQAEADAAEIKIIVPQVAHFETENFVVQVTDDRFLAASKPNASPAPLRDLVRGTFFILEHTPVKAMGLNYQMHFAMESEQRWHEIGDRLAPKEPWAGVLEGRPGMASLTILTQMDKPKGAQFRVKVEPSVQIPLGVYFETNEHYPAPEDEPLKSLMGTLGERWEEAQHMAPESLITFLHGQETGNDKNQSTSPSVAPTAVANDKVTSQALAPAGPIITFNGKSLLGAKQASLAEGGTFYSLQTSLEPTSSTSRNPMIPSGATVRPRLRLIPAHVTRLKTRQLWEGTVVEVREGGFVAVLTDKTNRNNPDEQVAFDNAEISPGDLQFVTPGSAFYWVIGNEKTPAGQVKNVSMVQFRRLPAWTQNKLDRAADRARHLRESLQEQA